MSVGFQSWEADGGHTDEESLEETGADDADVALVPLPSTLPDAESKFSCSDGEECEGDDLEYQTSQHDVPSEIV